MGLAIAGGVPPPPEQSTRLSALPRPLHRVHGPPPPRQGPAQTAAEGTAGGGVLPVGGGPRPGALAQPWRPPGPAEEAAVGCADGGAEAPPLGAHSELHHPSGEASTGQGTGDWGRGWGGGACGPDSLPSRPQEHYMASLMPLQKGIVPWKVWSRGGWGFSVRARGVPGKCPGESPKWPRRAPVRLVLQHQLARHSPRCHRLLPRSAPSARMTSCKAWSDLAPSSPVSSRATGWASTGGRPIGGVQGSRGQWAHATTVQPTGAHSHRPPAPTGGFSSPPILTGGTGSGTGR